MGKPRLIILIRHAQSEGNKNRAIHQLVPDHRVKLTEEGWKQAEEAGRRLRHLLKPDDTLQVFTSPYRRTRETTEAILGTLTAKQSTETSSPFSRHKIKVYEEPRLREQDFGNFQPCSAEMERMWKERADYGHFFYRIPNGESAADAYDRVSGFNESLWRQFGEKDFPSVLVLVTHGLMTRVFLMKWYHWSVEYFEDLRNINHCEFILMKQNYDTGKYTLESQLRTWSELKRQRAEEAERENPTRRNTLSAFLKHPEESPSVPARKWGGCPEGCDHKHSKIPDRTKTPELKLPPPSANVPALVEANKADDHPLASENVVADVPPTGTSLESKPAKFVNPFPANYSPRALPTYLSHQNRVPSGTSTPHEMPSDEEGDYFNTDNGAANDDSRSKSAPSGPGKSTPAHQPPERVATPGDIERWVDESGMGAGAHADALGDEPDPEEEVDRVLRKQKDEEEGVRNSVY